MSPFASPRRPEKYCTGSWLVMVYAAFIPTPASKPMVPKSPATFDVHDPAAMRPRPIIAMPVIAVYLLPKRCPILVANMPKAAPQERLSEPMKETVAVGTWLRELLRRAVCRIPQQLIIPLIQNVTTKPASTMAQPYPPSGMAVVLNASGAGD